MCSCGGPPPKHPKLLCHCVTETKPQGSSDSNLYKEKVILCIDDDEINQMILQGMLRSQLYR